jgi:hypothetical protein
MQQFLEGKVSDRKARLYCCACCRHIWYLFTDRRTRNAVEVTELYADGMATVEDVGEAEAKVLRKFNMHEASFMGFIALFNPPSVSLVAEEAAKHSGWGVAPFCDILRELFGNPFRATTLNPALRTADVVRLAEAAYSDRHLPSGRLNPACLAVLADALEDAGCADPDLLGHLRGPGPHVRGCWALDLLLGKS